MKVNIEKSENFSVSDLLKLQKAANLMEQVLNSDEFKTRILNFKYNFTATTGWGWWKKTNTYSHDGFHYTEDTNQQVFDNIQAGKELLSPDANGQADIEISLDNRTVRGVIGYTYATTPMQYIYSWFFNSSDIFDICENLMHEWIHKIGYDHEFNATPERDYTVPYALGYMAGEIARKLAGVPQQEVKKPISKLNKFFKLFQCPYKF